MTVRYTVAALSLLVGSVAFAEAQRPANAMTVFVAAAPLERSDADARQRREAAFAEAVNRRNDLDKRLKAQHGKKRDKWPAEAQDEYREAEESAELADVDRLYRELDQSELAGSVEDTRNAMMGAGLRGKRENVILVDSAADAQLIVELKGRRSTRGTGGVLGRHHFVLFAVKPGPMLRADRFAEITRTTRLTRPVVAAGSDESAWMFEAFGTGSWKVAGAHVATIVDRFIATHYAVLMTDGAQ